MRRILLLLFISSLSFSASAQIGKWTPGCYYLLDSSKVCGSIKWNVPPRNALFKGKGDNIQFRVADTSEKTKVSTNELRAFVIKADSFVVSRHPDLADYPVLQVEVNTPLKLYVSLREVMSSASAGGVTFSARGYEARYFYGANPDEVTQINRKNFIEAMSRVMAGSEYFVKAIKDELYRYGYMDELLLAYNTAKQRGLLTNGK
jgi:hypothetical protein